MNDHIGAIAGKVWEYISQKDKVDVAAIPRVLKEKSVFVYMGIGWLAREDKLTFTTSGEKTYVSVK